MKRKLLKQIQNEWRGNLWLMAELLIVSVVLWYITDNIFSTMSTLCEPRGFDTEHCYKITASRLDDNSPQFIPSKTNEQTNDDLLDLAARLRRRPEIEAVSLSMNSHPYNTSNAGTYLQVDTFSTGGQFCVRRVVSPDFVKVFKIEGVNGETPERLAELLRDPRNFLMPDNSFKHAYDINSMTRFIGRYFHKDNDSIRLAASIKPIRYHDYNPTDCGMTSIILSIPESDYLARGFINEICVRVRPDMDRDFIDNLFADADRELRPGNLFINSVTSFDDLRANFQYSFASNLRNMVTGMIFLMLNIFLGLLGSFWFRTQQRVKEIAIRKINGATSADIFRRLTGEGMLLLLMVTPLAAAIDITLAHYELNTFYHWQFLEWPRMIACIGITFSMIALMIVLGIYFPARRAMHIEPATALHDE